MLRNSHHKFISSDLLYKKLLGQILSKDGGLDAEELSQLSLNTLERICQTREWPAINFCLKQLKMDLERRNECLEQTLFGCHFINPIGLAAGFDKNGVAAAIWDQFGFGFAEIGTVTWHAQPGNPKPRLFRLAKEKAALNRMGFNNEGATSMLTRLKKQGIKERGGMPIPIGLNIGKSKIVPINEAHTDYSLSLDLLGPFADYCVINVSSPNTPGLRELQSPKALKFLISQLSDIQDSPPLLIKIAPDLNENDLNLIADIACEEKVAGIIATNTSLNRLGLENRKLPETGRFLKEEAGGLSGAPLRQKSLEIIRLLHKRTGDKLTLIGVGGVDSPESAWERIAAGASLVQIYTGWIYNGPGLVPRILEGLLKQLDKHGFKHISEAVGSEAKWKEE